MQTALIPPRHVQADLRLLYDHETRTGRYQIEVTDPETRSLLAMRSCPFTTDLTLDDVLAAGVAWLRRSFDQLQVGDPF